MNPSNICVDASIVIPLLVDSETVINESWTHWHESGYVLISPTLLQYEVTNALRSYQVHGELSEEETTSALRMVFDFDISLYDDNELHLQALNIANGFSLSATYDAHYLALAERFNAEFWTADRRLVQAVQEVLPWVHLVNQRNN